MVASSAWKSISAFSRAVFEVVEDIEEMPDGYAFHLPAETEAIVQAGRFISRERLCRPFFHFQLDVKPDRGSTCLKMTEDERVKQFLEETLLSE